MCQVDWEDDWDWEFEEDVEEDVEEEWAADNWCGNEWILSEGGNWYRDPCEGEGKTDCGWVYYVDYVNDYWWSCEEHADHMAQY